MWLIRLIGAVLVVIALVVVGLLLLPGDRVAALVADQVEARTGRKLEFSEGVKITLWPVLGVRTGPVRLGNPDWAGPEPMLTADALTVAVSAPDLLRGEIHVREVTLRNPDLRLKLGADGRGNWELSGGSASDTVATGQGGGQTAGAGETPLTLNRLRLTGARLSYESPGAAPVELLADELSLDWPDAAGPMRLAARIRPFGDPLDVTATIARPDALLAGEVASVQARLVAPGGSATFDGQASTAGAAAGHAEVMAEDTARLLAALGQPDAAPPQGMGRKARISADITWTADGRLSLRNLGLDLDDNRLTGEADVVLGQPANVVAHLAADTLDLTPIGAGADAGAGGASGAGAGTNGWPKDPIDASALRLVNGTIRLTANRVLTPVAPLSGLDATIRIDRARAVVTVQPLSVFAGTVQGEFVANGRSGLSVAARARMDGIELQDALARLAGVKRLSGKASGQIDVLGVGNSVDAIMRSLKGQGQIGTGRGVISGIDLDRLLRSGTGTGGTTVFDSLTATFTIRDGDLFNDDLKLKLSRITAQGAGRIGLGRRDIDYLFTPVAVKQGGDRQLAISVRIKGPWDDPAIKPDLSAALDAEIKAKQDELERKAREKALEKLGRELDTPVQTPQDAEKALKDKLEKEAKKGLLKLLGQD
ncbi:AsmA family protein [Jhaorihella thermophila]|uniref:AsmA protein n=1 Tax=Jhaorihella thermophila TaxID=488547 RepID=A0A1H5X0Y2_9RHOB|nr:AsmA family protein [Jhaorihella thermophila]SEG05055.1 AsmA protein [Jhaorihella thermophila]